MKVIRRIKQSNYTTISNAFLRNKDLSLKAKAILAMVMSLPDDWDFTVNGLVSLVKEGETVVRGAIKELKIKGYCKVDVIRNGSRITKWMYYFREDLTIPFPETLHVENLQVETLHVENQAQINKDNKENTEYNKEKNKEKDDLFIQFWNTYNKKVGQIPALRAWKKLTADDKRKAIEGIKTYQESMHFDKHYIKHPATYLNQRTWEDDFTDYNSKSFYEIREDDTDKEKRFKEHMRKKHPAIEQVRCPLSMCAYIDLANVYGSESVEQELTKIENNIALYKLSDISYEIAKSLEKGRI